MFMLPYGNHLVLVN